MGPDLEAARQKADKAYADVVKFLKENHDLNEPFIFTKEHRHGLKQLHKILIELYENEACGNF